MSSILNRCARKKTNLHEQPKTIIKLCPNILNTKTKIDVNR